MKQRNVICFVVVLSHSQPLNKNQAPDRVLQKSLQLLDSLCRALPGLQIATYYSAKTKFLSGEQMLCNGTGVFLARDLHH